MNYLIVIGLLLLAAVLILSYRLFLTVLASISTHLSTAIYRYSGLKLPMLNVDDEVSNLSLVLIAKYIGFPYGFVLLALTALIHFLHVEIVDLYALLRYAISGLVIIVFIRLFPSLSLLVFLPYLMGIVKAVTVIYNTLIGFPLLSPANIQKAFSVLYYFAAVNIIELLI